MTRRFAMAALGTLLLLIAVAPAQAAQDYRDRQQVRCIELQHKAVMAIRNHLNSPNVEKAQRKAKIGMMRCDGRDYISGIKMLIQSLRLLGETVEPGWR